MKRTGDVAVRGQLVPFVALSMLVLLGFAALAIDVGFWRFQHQLQQSAADSAAIAGAVSLSYSADIASMTAAARTDAGSNGFVHDGLKVKVVVNAPPLAGAYVGNSGAVEVVIAKQQPTFFSKVWGPAYQTISARAVALLSDPGRNCIYGLGTSGTSVLINGSTVKVPGCGIVSDGDMSLNGSTITAVTVGYVGSLFGSPGYGTVPRKTLPATDPCPSIAGCAYLTANPPIAGACMPALFNGQSNVTINPGTYCSQLVINGCTNVTFAPGFYLFKQGILLNGASNVTGSGVTFYTAAGSETINASSTHLTAPTSGTTMGMLFYQVSSDTGTLTYNGTNGFTLAGAIYFPKAHLTVNGSLGTWTLLIGAAITINGSTASLAGSPYPGITHAVLAE